jgi:hypothetical protein
MRSCGSRRRLDEGVEKRLDNTNDKTGRRSGDGDWKKVGFVNRHCGNASNLEVEVGSEWRA